MAIIDYLQSYNSRKKFEYWWKVNILQNGKDLISAVPASIYAKRFFDFMRNEVIIDDKESMEERGKLSLSSSRETEVGIRPSGSHLSKKNSIQNNRLSS